MATSGRRHSRAVIVVCLVILPPAAVGLPCASDGAVIQGVVQESQGQRALHVWGSHYEMGYAHGYLLGDEVVNLIDDYIIPLRWGPWSFENTIRPYVTEYFVLPPEYEDELLGMWDGIRDSGFSTDLQSVGRELDLLDLHTANLWGDFTQYQCSSISAWGGITSGDAVLEGGAAMVRNFEYGSGPDGLLPRHSLLIAYSPSSPGEREWVSIGWPGFIGCLSGMNELGLASATNGGESTAPAEPEPHSLIGHFFTVRDAIEDVDENQDGEQTIEDIIYAVDRDPRLGALLTHVISPFEVEQTGEPAVVIEMDSHGYALRSGANNLDYPTYIYSEDCLLVMNHCRVYMDPEPVSWNVRYNSVADSLNVDLHVDTEELWRLGASISSPATLHAVLFRPNLRDVFVAYGDSAANAYEGTRVHWTWESLFPQTADVASDEAPTLKIQPNPFWDGANLWIPPGVEYSSLQIYNCLGRLVFEVPPPARGQLLWHGQDNSGRALPAGVYFCRLAGTRDVQTAKLVLVR